MSVDVELAADAALVAVLTSDGDIRGTGFVIGKNGVVLTCHHVVDGLQSLRLRGPDGSDHVAGIADVLAAPEIDLAVVRSPGLTGIPLPLASEPGGFTAYWTKGFHRLSGAIRAGFPVQGTITGRTSVSYTAGATRYQVNDVLVLRDDEIEPGLSGAPVLDKTAGVVIGVVSTRLVRKDNPAGRPGGFGIPIGHTAVHTGLAEIVARNAATVPAYGRYLNAPAALELCAAVTGSATEDLAVLRGVDLQRRVRRAEAEAVTNRFLASDDQVLALVGSSGVGKSTELASLSQRMTLPALLLRVSSIRGDSTHLGDAVAAALADIPARPLLPDDPDVKLASAVAGIGGLVVLLDGLNELLVSRTTLEEWVLRTRSWLRRTSARLIVSCKPEIWRDAGRILMAGLGSREPAVVALGEFSGTEYLQATGAYGLTIAPDWPILRLPLALSLFARSEPRQTQQGDADASINTVVSLYVEEAARRIAAKSGPHVSAEVMKDRLLAAAGRMFQHDTEVLDVASFSEIFGFAGLADAITLDGLMTQVPGGYRFAHDDVGEWLKAQQLDLAAVFPDVIRGDERFWRRAGAVAYALREIERREGPDAFRVKLAQLVATATAVDSLQCWIAEQALAKLADATPYLRVLGQITELTLNEQSPSPFGFDDYYDKIGSINFWQSVPLPVSGKLAMLRQLVTLDHEYFGWRPKDWSQWDLADLGSFTQYATLAADLVRQEPAAGIPALLPWLDDQARLARREATVADVAMGIFFRLRRVHGEQVWSAMTRAGVGKCLELINRLVMDDPQWLAQMLAGERAAEADDMFAIRIAVELQRAALPAELAEAVRKEVAGRYARGLAGALTGSALTVLTRGNGEPAYVTALVKAYQERDPAVDEWALVQLAGHSVDLVMPILLGVIGRPGERRDNALAALANSTDARVVAVTDRAMLDILQRQPDSASYSVYKYAEDRLWRSSSLTNDLHDLVQHLIVAPRGPFRKLLAHPLTSRDALREDPIKRTALLQGFIDASHDPEDLELTAEDLILAIKQYPDPDAFARLAQVLARLDSQAADRLLLSQVSSDADTAVLVARWLVKGQLLPPGEYMKKFKQLIEAGVPAGVARRQLVRIG